MKQYFVRYYDTDGVPCTEQARSLMYAKRLADLLRHDMPAAYIQIIERNGETESIFEEFGHKEAPRNESAEC